MQIISRGPKIMCFRHTESRLPWTNKSVRSTGNLYRYLAGQLGDQSRYLPLSITLFSDLSVEEADVGCFLEELLSYLKYELYRRQERQRQFIDLGLLSENELDNVLTEYRHLQPWAIYYSQHGGLDIQDPIPEKQALWGVVPCSSMPNHGVAWRKTSPGRHQVWLATARKPEENWDWDSDIGHESAHASFAPIPLFAQSAHLDPKTTYLADIDDAQNLTPAHLARMCYTYAEIAVVALRGEQRLSETGLPVLESPDELYAFLELSNQLMPDLGFDRALEVSKQLDGKFDVVNRLEIFKIGAPIIRVLPSLSSVIGTFVTPSFNWYYHRSEQKLK
jgi:hypothetical protein